MSKNTFRSLVISSLVTLITAFTVSFPVHAQEEQVCSYEGIPYISGGIGLDDRENLIKVGTDYNLKLVFAMTTGNFLADVSVRIYNAMGNKVLEAVSQGPWFFTRLPAGRYTIEAETLGKAQKKSVTVGREGQRQVDFYWRG